MFITSQLAGNAGAATGGGVSGERGASWRFPASAVAAFRPAMTELQRMAELERKIGQLTMENDFLKKC